VGPKDLGDPLGGDMISLFDCHVDTVNCDSTPIKPFVLSQEDYDLLRQATNANELLRQRAAKSNESHLGCCMLLGTCNKKAWG
jgi:hypothetical protein